MIKIDYIDKEQALRYMGYKGQEIDEHLALIIDDAIKQCLETAHPAYTYKIYPISHTSSGVEIGGSGLFLEGKDIYNHLTGCDTCALMGVTIGAMFDHRLNMLQTADQAKSIIFNSCGSALVEQVCDAVEAEILAKTGKKKHNFRFSPGYGDLPLSAQKTIFKLLTPEKLAGITLTPSNLLVPVKSVTAILGLSDTAREIISDKCSVCSIRNTCKLRKGGNTCDNTGTHKE